MSAEIMVWDFVRRLSVVCLAIIFEPHARISLKFQLFVTVDHTPGRVLKKKTRFPIFHESLLNYSKQMETSPEFSS